jgi:hypothetical protein
MIRREKVGLDVDLAEFYCVTTKRLNERKFLGKDRDGSKMKLTSVCSWCLWLSRQLSSTRRVTPASAAEARRSAKGWHRN